MRIYKVLMPNREATQYFLHKGTVEDMITARAIETNRTIRKHIDPDGAIVYFLEDEDGCDTGFVDGKFIDHSIVVFPLEVNTTNPKED
jgi:hypothetical protein